MGSANQKTPKAGDGKKKIHQQTAGLEKEIERGMTWNTTKIGQTLVKGDRPVKKKKTY